MAERIYDDLATKTTRNEFRVWRRVLGINRRWTTVSSRGRAEEIASELRGDRYPQVPVGIERVFVIKESDGIEWQE